jgi:hypothetical protein
VGPAELNETPLVSATCACAALAVVMARATKAMGASFLNMISLLK